MFSLLSSIHLKPEYIAIMAASLIIIISFIFNFISKKTNIPSVLLLLVLGVGIQFLAPELKADPIVSKLLIIVGKVGLILIVLEAALDLKLKRDKLGLIGKSLVMALLGLVVSAVLIAYAIQYFLDAPFINSLAYAVPLSIMSSAIIIPSVGGLAPSKKEFMIYESTFSDIFGIIFFQFLTSSESYESAGALALNVIVDLAITIAIAVVLSYLMVWMFQRITSHVKLFLIIAVLMLVYAVGSVLGISSLIIILFFGLILNNVKLFFRGPLKKLVDEEEIKPVFHEFHIITLESAFVLRTFFFVMFGVSISLMSLVDWHVAMYSIVIVAILYVVRFLFLKIILWGEKVTPELYLAPRGLITVLLFYTIPNGIQNYTSEDLAKLKQNDIDYVYMDASDDKQVKLAIDSTLSYDKASDAFLVEVEEEVKLLSSIQLNKLTRENVSFNYLVAKYLKGKRLAIDSTLAYDAKNKTFLVQIPSQDLTLKSFDPGILLYTILITSLVMTFALILSRGQKVREVLIDNLNFNILEDQMQKEKEEDEEEYFDEMDKAIESEEEVDDDENISDIDTDDQSVEDDK